MKSVCGARSQVPMAIAGKLPQPIRRMTHPTANGQARDDARRPEWEFR
jgi:hypothetical protein